MSKELKNGNGILVGQAVIRLWIKTVILLFWSITQEPLDLLKFKCFFFLSFLFSLFSPLGNLLELLFFKKVLTILRQSAKHANFWLRVQFLLNLAFSLWHISFHRHSDLWVFDSLLNQLYYVSQIQKLIRSMNIRYNKRFVINVTQQKRQRYIAVLSSIVE